MKDVASERIQSPRRRDVQSKVRFSGHLPRKSSKFRSVRPLGGYSAQIFNGQKPIARCRDGWAAVAPVGGRQRLSHEGRFLMP